MLTGCIELSDHYQLCRRTHLLETKVQNMLVHEKYGCSIEPSWGYLRELITLLRSDFVKCQTA
jgi:hypothetical protein